MENIFKFSEEDIKKHFMDDINEYGLILLDKFYDKTKNELSKEVLSVSIILYNTIQNGVNIEDIESVFDEGVAKVVFNITNYEEDIKLKPYEKILQKYDYIFVKLIIRIAKIYVSVNELNNDKFKEFINEYNELRRKVLKDADPNIITLMDYESDLIKYGRNRLSGKPAGSYKYDSLILNG